MTRSHRRVHLVAWLMLGIALSGVLAAAIFRTWPAEALSR